jgi:hypothetical protein
MNGFTATLNEKPGLVCRVFLYLQESAIQGLPGRLIFT